MTLNDAILLIQNENITDVRKSVWADLGCGSGIFTFALASLLNEESIVYAIDKNISTFKINPSVKKVFVKPIELDFENAVLPFKNIDGMLMANSLHFVKNKKMFLEKIKHYLNKNGRFLIVEYDIEIANRWVPYPISFLLLKEMFNDAGYSLVTKINERPSAFNTGNMYSALIQT
jgi:ubiquinone/menaquinone biosynthesis C-methylase UbiE